MLEYLIYIIIGTLAGMVNTLAGGGSVFTLTALTFYGMPIDLANGTNRLGLVVQSSTGSYAFLKKGLVDWQKNYGLVIVVILGALVGSLIAVYIDKSTLKKAVGVILLSLFIVFSLRKQIQNSKLDLYADRYKPILYLVLFLAGIYGGFIQAGIGLIVITILSLFKPWALLNCIALRSIMITIYTIPVLFIFVYHDQVVWKMGLILAIGQWIGTRLSTNYLIDYKGINAYINYLVMLMMLVGGIKMLL